MKKIQGLIFCILIVILFGIWVIFVTPNTTITDGRNENSNMVQKGFENLPDFSLDYLAIGSSNIFMNINPIEIWDKYNLCGYDYVSPMQALSTSELYIKEALKTQKPKVILLDALGIAQYDYAGDGYTHLGMDYLSLNQNKADAIQKLPNDKESFWFPFIQYHSRWNELTKSDFDMLQYHEYEDFLGYTPAYTKTGGDRAAFFQPGTEISISDANEESFGSIVNICNSAGIQLVVIKTPNFSWTQEMSKATRELCDKFKITFIDLNANIDEYNFNTMEDFCDGGGHLNEQGANKVSDYLAEYMLQIDSFDKEKNEEVKRYYDERKKLYLHYKSICQLKNTENYYDYISAVANGEYDVIICADLTGMNAEKNALKKAFHLKKIKDIFCFIYADGESYYSAKGKKKKLSIKDYYTEIQKREDGENHIIQYKYQNYARNGIVDIVVYDKVYDAVIDTVSVSEIEGEVKLER